MPLIRIAEWQKRVAPPAWTREVRDAFGALALGWKNAHNLGALPLEWTGNGGQNLSVRQWVGVLEWGDFRIEIYPKLDAYWLKVGGGEDETEGENGGADEVEKAADSSLRSLLSMLAAANYGDWVESGRASLRFEPLQFADVWAFLLGKNLAPLLRGGMAHAYVTLSDDLPSVRGKIAVARQVSQHFNRADKLACVWDEWSGDNALNRLLKCALLWLRKRVNHSVSKAVLGECLGFFEGVQSVSPREALAQTARFAFSRATLRFQNAFDLSRRLLASQSPDFGAAGAQSWVFLTDMNRLFESFVAAALRENGAAGLETQAEIGHLFAAPRSIRQLPDFLWRSGEGWHLGDAKWKLLAQNAPQFGEEDEIIRAGRAKVSPDDARQMSVYSEILKRREKLATAPPVTIFYPLLSGTPALLEREMWNGAALKLQPVRVRDFRGLSGVLSQFQASEKEASQLATHI